MDDDGLADFLAARGPALLRFAWLLTADREAARDLVQEALVRALPRWRRVEPLGREAYLRTAIRSTWVDGWRRAGRGRFTVVSADPLPDDALPDPAPGLTDRLVLRDALAALPPGQRAVVVLRFYEDLTEVQTARVLGCSTSTVKSQTRAALVRLRSLVPEFGVDRLPGAVPDLVPDPAPDPVVDTISAPDQPGRVPAQEGER